MKRFLSLTLLIGSFGIISCSTLNKARNNPASATDGITIRFNKNVELLGYMIGLAESNPNNPTHPISQILQKGAADAKNSNLYKIYEMAGDMPYAFFVELFYFLPSFPLEDTTKLPGFILDSFGYDTPEAIKKVEKLVAYSQAFYLESQFETIWEELEIYRKTTCTIIQEKSSGKRLLLGMESFYQQNFSEYRLVPSLTFWPGPGWGFKTEGDRPAAIFVSGPLRENYDYSDSERLMNLTIHEFGHSFVNHLVLSQLSESIKQTEVLFEPLREAMTPQGYPDWESCVIEHFVRAGEVLVAEMLGDTAVARTNLNDQSQDRRFIYLPFIVDQLRELRFREKMDYSKALDETMIRFTEVFLRKP